MAFEFRHPSWFDDEVFGLLREHRAALCIADAEDDLEVPVVATTTWGCLRLRRPDYDDAALKTWVKRVRKLDWRDAFVFFKHEDEGKGPQLAKRFLELGTSGPDYLARPLSRRRSNSSRVMPTRRISPIMNPSTAEGSNQKVVIMVRRRMIKVPTTIP